MPLPAETFDAIVELANKAKTPHAARISDEKTQLFFSDGSIQTINTEPPRRSSSVSSLRAFVVAVHAFSVPGESSIWHSSNGVYLIIDDDDRRDTVHLPLTLAEPFTVLRDGGIGGRQPTVCRLLKHLFLDAYAPADLLPILRTLDWSVLNSAQGDHLHTTDSMGRQVHAEVKSKSGVEIPEAITLSTPVYSSDGADFITDVNCSLDMDIKAESITITPFPGEIERAEQWVQSKIASRLKELLAAQKPAIEIPIFHGSA